MNSNTTMKWKWLWALRLKWDLTHENILTTIKTNDTNFHIFSFAFTPQTNCTRITFKDPLCQLVWVWLFSPLKLVKIQHYLNHRFHLDCDRVYCASDFKAPLPEHHDRRVVDAGSCYTQRHRQRLPNHKTTIIIFTSRAQQTLTFRKYQDGKFGLSCNMSSQPVDRGTDL